MQAAKTYGNWTRPSTAGLWGLGSFGTALALIGLVGIVLTVATFGIFKAIVPAIVLGLVLLAVTVKDRHGKSAIARMTVRMGWWMARSKGTHLYRSGPLGLSPWGTCQLPGLLAATRLSEHVDSYNRPFALLCMPQTQHYSVTIGAEPDGAALVDQEQVDDWVSAWGEWLKNLADEPGLVAASVTIETAPDSGTRLRREVKSNLDPDAPEFARRMLMEVMESYPAGSSTVKAYIALTFQAKKRTPEEIGRDLAARLPTLTHGLAAAGAGAARPLSAQELCEAVRIAYDPEAAVSIDEARADGKTPELRWYDVGPIAAQASWRGYRHDSGFSTTWSMTEAPRGHIQSNSLARLLSPHRDIARKRVTFLYRPIDAARAAHIVENDLHAAQFRLGSQAKPSARAAQATRSAERAAAEEAGGAGLINFGLLVTATVMDAKEQAQARSTIEDLASSARITLRPIFGSQDSAFAGALPLGLVLAKHLKVPAELKELIG